MLSRWLGVAAAAAGIALTAAAIGLAACGLARAADEVTVPPLKTRITDLTGTLTAEQKTGLCRDNAMRPSTAARPTRIRKPASGTDSLVTRLGL